MKKILKFGFVPLVALLALVFAGCADPSSASNSSDATSTTESSTSTSTTQTTNIDLKGNSYEFAYVYNSSNSDRTIITFADSALSGTVSYNSVSGSGSRSGSKSFTYSVSGSTVSMYFAGESSDTVTLTATANADSLTITEDAATIQADSDLTYLTETIAHVYSLIWVTENQSSHANTYADWSDWSIEASLSE